MANFAKMANQRAANALNDNKIIEIDPKDLIDDPENQEIYQNDDVEGLAKAMEEGGMFGVILAYPYEGGYRIESGHRRKQAAIKAGLTKVNVFVTDPPKDEIERKKRLVRANLHLRNYSPMTYAREAEYLYTTFVKENQKLAEEGLASKMSPIEKVAEYLEVSTSLVSRYRKLIKLPEKLQKLLEEYPNLPWNALSDGEILNETQADMLYKRIQSEIKLHGETAVTAKFVKDEIIQCHRFKGVAESFDRESLAKYQMDNSELTEQKRKTRIRRLNGATSIHKGCSLIFESLDPSLSYIKEIQQEAVLDDLKNLSKYLQEKITEIEEYGFKEDFTLK